MKILKDADNDFWEQREDGLFECVTAPTGFSPATADAVAGQFGPIRVFMEDDPKRHGG